MERLIKEIGSPRSIFEAEREMLLEEFPEYREKLRMLCLGREGWEFEKEDRELKEKESVF